MIVNNNTAKMRAFKKACNRTSMRFWSRLLVLCRPLSHICAMLALSAVPLMAQMNVSSAVTPAIWWTLGLLLAIALGLVSWVARLIDRRKLEASQVRARIARDLHDDIGASLSAINILSDLARRQLSRNPQKAEETLQKISDNAQQMMEAMDDIIWSIDPYNDSMPKMLARMRQFAANTLEARDISVTFKVDEGVDVLRLDLESRRDLFMIYKEAVNNLAKYSMADKAKIRVEIDGGNLVLSVKDDGVGFDTDGPIPEGSGYGLENMQKRAGQLQGRLRIKSEKGKGAKITVEMPLR
jgi:signal transduction histidine kinase